MSGVHKADRGQSDFRIEAQLKVLKRGLRELSIVRNFGFKIRESKLPSNFDKWSDKSKETWRANEDKRIERLRELDKSFLSDKRKAVDEDIMTLAKEISRANEIKRPSCMAEADERRIHQDRAINACFDLRIDLQDIMDTMPIDKNWMTHFDPQIDVMVAMLRSWKRSDNEMRRAIRLSDMQRWLKFIAKTIKEHEKAPDDPDKAVEANILKGVYHAFLNDVERCELAKKDDETPTA